MKDVGLADIWNTASVVHSSGYMSGWKGYSYLYDSRSVWGQAISFFSPELWLGYRYADLIGTVLWYHNDPITSNYTLKYVAPSGKRIAVPAPPEPGYIISDPPI